METIKANLPYTICQVSGSYCYLTDCVYNGCQILREIETRKGYTIAKVPYSNEETIGE